MAIRACLDELYAAGVEQKDVLLLFSNGLHPRATVAEMQTILGPELFGEFYPTGQITSHDSEDYDHLADLATPPRGTTIMNKYVYDADVAVLIGHAGQPLAAATGGCKHCATGISPLAEHLPAHRAPQVMHRQGSSCPCPRTARCGTSSTSRACTWRRRWARNSSAGTPCWTPRAARSRFTPAGLGDAARVLKMADKRTYVHWAEKKYRTSPSSACPFTNFHYGNGMGTNPIQMMQALSAQVIRHRRIMSERCVFSSICDGYFHDERWPYLRELYDLFQHDYMNILPDMNRYGEYFATKEEYIRKYRFANAFHPFHGFSMMSCGHLAEEHTSAIYIVGAREPGIARSMGLKTRATFEEALADAMRKYTGPNPNILALPRTFTTAAVHLCMKDGDLRGV